MGLFQLGFLCLFLLLLLKTQIVSSQHIGQIYPGFQTSQKDWAEKDGVFLLSRNSTFGFCFYTGLDVNIFVLVIKHIKSGKIVWTANRGLLVTSSDKFVFETNGNTYLQRGNGILWSTNTGGQGATSMELMDSGNLVLRGEERSVLWESFGQPTDTLLPGQEFIEGMRLGSFRNKNNISCSLEIISGDLVLSAGYRTPQIYWSLAKDPRMMNRSITGKVHSATLGPNSWNFYDRNKVLLSRFLFSSNADPNATWAVVLETDGAIEFYDLQKGKSVTSEATKIPENPCGVPERCDPFFVCYFNNRCQCPLRNPFSCRSPLASPCNNTTTSVELLYVTEKIDYFALEFVTPALKSNLSGCREACLANCSCVVLFFKETTGSCFLFDQLGSFTRSQDGSSGHISYVKVSSGEVNLTGGKNESKDPLVVVFISTATVVVIAGLLYVGLWQYRKKKSVPEFPEEIEDGFFDNIRGMPLRYSFDDLYKATKNFTMKVGQGGFGSVYQGVLPDETRIAIKKLEGIGQGMKEFRAEVTIIGSIHHVHLVRLKGFCAEGYHRLLVYEYMGNGSLDKWIFKNNEESTLLDWNTRFNIALGTAKGLAYLHEECEMKIVHCDIKPENVLLDDNFNAKVTDFGLAKLMNRDDNVVYTTVRGTRGYLAPEWVTNNPISEKTDVYSYGIVLLEIIRGRRNYDSAENSENSHIPSYSFKMLEEGKLREIVDPKLEIVEDDEKVVNVIKVALWCIQDDMKLRPQMTKVVQMLEGVCAVPEPPTSQLISRSYPSFINRNSEDGSASGFLDDSSDALHSDTAPSAPI